MLRDPILSVWWTKVAIFDLSTYLPRAGCLSIELNVRNELKQGGEMLWQQVAGWNPPNWWIFEHASRVTRANCKQKHATINILGSTIYHLPFIIFILSFPTLLLTTWWLLNPSKWSLICEEMLLMLLLLLHWQFKGKKYNLPKLWFALGGSRIGICISHYSYMRIRCREKLVESKQVTQASDSISVPEFKRRL